MTVYYDAAQSGASGEPAAILAIGDSWFWYPFQNNLLAGLSRIVRPDYGNIMALGQNGATLKSYVSGVHAPSLARELKPERVRQYSAVLISGGGNDVVDWSLCLKDDCAGCSAPACFADALVAHLHELQGWVAVIAELVQRAFDAAGVRRPAIFTHTYDVAPPNGEPARLPLVGVSVAGPWIKPALDRARVELDVALRREVVRLFMGRLQDAYVELETACGINVVRSQGTLLTSDWANELHPTGMGFTKLVSGPWRAAMRQAGFV